MPPVPIHPPAIEGFSSEQSLSQTTGTERKWNCDAAAPQATQHNQLWHMLPPQRKRVLIPKQVQNYNFSRLRFFACPLNVECIIMARKLDKTPQFTTKKCVLRLPGPSGPFLFLHFSASVNWKAGSVSAIHPEGLF